VLTTGLLNDSSLPNRRLETSGKLQNQWHQRNIW
jgi:hypothetical protein